MVYQGAERLDEGRGGREGKMPVDHMPVLETTVCRACNYVWNAFYPMGRQTDDAIECPNCHQFTGVPK